MAPTRREAAFSSEESYRTSSGDRRPLFQLGITQCLRSPECPNRYVSFLGVDRSGQPRGDIEPFATSRFALVTLHLLETSKSPILDSNEADPRHPSPRINLEIYENTRTLGTHRFANGKYQWRLWTWSSGARRRAPGPAPAASPPWQTSKRGWRWNGAGLGPWLNESSAERTRRQRKAVT
jgi:hypothetical protein